MKENKNMSNAAANNNFNNNEGGIVMTTGTMTMDVFAGTVKEALAVYFGKQMSLLKIPRMMLRK